MKIRADFVTNSSSSSFTLMIRFDLTDGRTVRFDAQGGTGETGRIDYFDDSAFVTVSPKQLGCAKSIDELIGLLENGVFDGWDKMKIFDASRPMQSDACYLEDEVEECLYDAYDFVEEIRANITDMDQIAKITISGDEENYESCCRTYTYDRKTSAYTGVEKGCEFEKDGSSGGDLRFSDLNDCHITYMGDDE